MPSTVFVLRTDPSRVDGAKPRRRRSHMLNAVILAAGCSGDDFRSAFATVHKCLAEVAGRPMIRWVLDAVAGARYVNRIIVVGPEGPLLSLGVQAQAQLVPQDGGSYPESLRAGVEAAAGDKVLLIAADVPLLRAEGLDKYLLDCLRSKADVCFPVVSWEAMCSRCPGARKTWYHLRDGQLTKGNAVVGPRDFFLSRLDRIEGLFETRKKKRWAGLICHQFMHRLLTRAATKADVEAMLSSYLGVRLKGIPADPSLAVDVDEVSDVAFVDGVLRRRIHRGRPGFQPMIVRESTQAGDTLLAAVQ
jgi:GTP:adenosylcobinamide-phosphate guanylyltransferase